MTPERQVEILSAKFKDLERERDGWKHDCDMYAHAWQRELGSVIHKTHLIDSLVLTTRTLVASERSLREELASLRAAVAEALK